MNIKIGAKIKELRKRNNMTQEQLADKIGVTNQAISRWESETGYPDIEYIKPVAEFFNVTIDSLFEDNGENCEEINSEIFNLSIKEGEFTTVMEAGKKLKDKISVLIKFESIKHETQRFYLGFLDGVAFTVGGDINRVSDDTFILTPSGVNYKTVMESINA